MTVVAGKAALKPGPPELLLNASKPLLAANPLLFTRWGGGDGWGKCGGEKLGAAENCCCWKLGPPEFELNSEKLFRAGEAICVVFVTATDAKGSSPNPAIAVGLLSGEAPGVPPIVDIGDFAPAGTGADDIGGVIAEGGGGGGIPTGPILGRFNPKLPDPVAGFVAGAVVVVAVGESKGLAGVSPDPENPKSSRSI